MNIGDFWGREKFLSTPVELEPDVRAGREAGRGGPARTRSEADTDLDMGTGAEMRTKVDTKTEAKMGTKTDTDFGGWTLDDLVTSLPTRRDLDRMTPEERATAARDAIEVARVLQSAYKLERGRSLLEGLAKHAGSLKALAEAVREPYATVRQAIFQARKALLNA